MAITGKVQLDNIIPEIWSKQLYSELRNQIIFANLFSRQYEGEILAFGDTVNVNQIVAPTAEVLTDDTSTFASQLLVVNKTPITVNKRASASFEITDLAQLQSMKFNQEIRDALVYAIRRQLESDIVAALIPSAAAPDHDISPAVAGQLAAVDIGTIRTLMSTALIPAAGRSLILSPSYYGDLINSTNIMSADFTSGNSAESAVVAKYAGFAIQEHNILGNDVGYAVVPDALALVMQQDVRVQISNLHAVNKYSYLISADFVYGMKLMDNKRIVKISG